MATASAPLAIRRFDRAEIFALVADDDCSAPAEWSRWNVSLRLAVAPAWPAEPVGVAQPATRRTQARTPLLLVACIRLRHDRVVVASPALDDDLGLAQSVEDLAVEQLIAQASVEALDVAVLPRAAPLDVGGLVTDHRNPFLHGLGGELRSVVGPDVSGNAPQDEEVGDRKSVC